MQDKKQKLWQKSVALPLLLEQFIEFSSYLLDFAHILCQIIVHVLPCMWSGGLFGFVLLCVWAVPDLGLMMIFGRFMERIAVQDCSCVLMPAPQIQKNQKPQPPPLLNEVSQYTSNLYCNTPPICIAVLLVPLCSEERGILSVLLPFVSQYYCNTPPIRLAVLLGNLGGCGHRDAHQIGG